MLEAKNIAVSYRQGLFAPRQKQIVSGVSFTLKAGESLGIIGKSGSGKTTVAGAVLGLIPCRSGDVLLDGRPVRTGYTRIALAKKIQLVTQNPETSFDPDRTLAQCFREVLRIHKMLPRGTALREKTGPLLADVGLAGANLDKMPRHFSGGELQRLSIVRALLLSPQILVFDEADSMLDTATRVELFAMLGEVRKKRGLSYIYITHDIRVLPHLADTVLVLEDGKMIEYGPVSLLHRSDAPFIKQLRDSLVVEAFTPTASA